MHFACTGHQQKSTESGKQDMACTPSLVSRRKSKDKEKNSKKEENKDPFREIEEVVSFQCFFEIGEKEKKMINYSFPLEGYAFTVREVRFPTLSPKGPLQIASYNNFSQLLAKNFHYDVFLTKAGLELGTDETTKIVALSKPDYLMTKLELLRNADIFLGNQWIYERRDLLEVYPFYLHLKHFVGAFRAKYKEEKGRL